MSKKKRIAQALKIMKSAREYPAEGEPRRTKDGYPEEVVYDEFSYNRMCDSYRDAFNAAIKVLK